MLKMDIDIIRVGINASIVRYDKLLACRFVLCENKCFVIECDGHEFHQKTKEQVERDNARMRALQKEGYEVIRFSGTEIWHKPYKCANEVLNIILSKCKYIKEENKNGKEKDVIS